MSYYCVRISVYIIVLFINTDIKQGLFNVEPQAGFCLYKLPDGDQEGCLDSEEYKISHGIPPNNSVNVLIRVYIVAVSFHLILSRTQVCYKVSSPVICNASLYILMYPTGGINYINVLYPS